MILDNIKKAFIDECRANNIKNIKKLYEYKYNFNVYKPGFIQLAYYNHLETLEYLLLCTEKINIDDELKYGIIVGAMCDNNMKIVKMMVENYTINFDYSPKCNDIIITEVNLFRYGITLLEYCQKNDLDEYRWLFEKYIIPKHCKCCNSIKKILNDFNKNSENELGSKLQEIISEINKVCNH